MQAMRLNSFTVNENMTIEMVITYKLFENIGIEIA